MSNGLLENNRERNAYHEAGHVALAWRKDPQSVGYVEINMVARALRETVVALEAEFRNSTIPRIYEALLRQTRLGGNAVRELLR